MKNVAKIWQKAKEGSEYYGGIDKGAVGGAELQHSIHDSGIRRDRSSGIGRCNMADHGSIDHCLHIIDKKSEC